VRTYVRMAHSRYLREMARLMRVQRQLSVDQLARRLALPRSTIYYWVRDLPLREPTGRVRPGGATRARRGSVRVVRPRRAGAYEQALSSYDDLITQPTFGDFLCIYIADGYKRDRRTVALASADADVMRLAHRWIWRLTDRSPSLSVRHASDQSRAELQRFWSEAVGEGARSIRARHVGEAELAHSWGARPLYGVLTASVDDGVLRARMQAWMRRTRDHWP
jgi:hypothetical protein